VDTIELHELQQLLDDRSLVRVVMTLGARRYAQAHIPGTETFDSIEDALAALHPDEEVVVYCTGGSCPSSRWAYHLLRSRGYDHVRLFTGGLMAWDAAELPLEGEVAA
jgi:3-mercaptopyruvate sulfurtransferase SseA